MRRFLLAAAVLACAWSAAVVPARAAGQPNVYFVSPTSATAGQPVRVTLTGRGFTGITDVLMAPEVPGRAFQVFNDTTALLIIPATAPPGTYTVRVIAPDGGSSPESAPAVQLLAPAPKATPAPVDSGPALLPTFSFLPQATASAPSGSAESSATVQAPVTTPVLVAQVTESPFANPLFDVALGIFAGGTMYVLWGHPGRMGVARRRDIFAQLVARPAQRFHLGRICLQCGRLHWIFRTRRDLWKAGQFCSATCFVAAQEEAQQASEGYEAAPGRLREVTVFSDLERMLEGVFAGEAQATASPETLFSAEVGAMAWTADDTSPEDEPVGINSALSA